MFARRRPPAANSFWFRVVNKLCLAVCPRQPVPLHVEDLTGLNNYNLEHQAAFREVLRTCTMII
jgi:hypothetical protein